LVDEHLDVQLLSTEFGEHEGWSEPGEGTADHGRRLSSIWLEKELPVVPSVFYRSMDLRRHSVGLKAYSLVTVDILGSSVTPKRLDRGAPEIEFLESDAASSRCGLDGRAHGSYRCYRPQVKHLK
jgi:hypothetical protein